MFKTKKFLMLAAVAMLALPMAFMFSGCGLKDGNTVNVNMRDCYGCSAEVLALAGTDSWGGTQLSAATVTVVHNGANYSITNPHSYKICCNMLYVYSGSGLRIFTAPFTITV